MRFQKLVNRQREFFLEGTTRSYEFRRSQLKLLRELVAKNRENIAAAIFKDLRRPYPVALITEADSTLGKRRRKKGRRMREFAEEIDYVLENFKRWMQPEEKRDEPYGQVAVLKEPLGVVLIVGPYNFPITLALRPLIVAMAAGNCAVVKPSELAVHSSRFLFELIARNFNNDYVAVVEGGVPETTRLLDQHFDHIFYTGSSRNGRLVMAAAAHHLTPVTLELGGKCPAVFADECDVKKSVDALCAGKFMNLGQTCMAPDYIVCVRDVKEGFVRAARSWLKENFTEHPKKSPAYGRLINRMHCNRLLNLLERSHGKVSGMGKYHGRYGFDSLTHEKAVVKNFFRG
ncbi:Aldehyde dehydrogenase [Aphelenchoides fujianensis]|nr:Aldehyde dehydrogenase [Aphelenchoides fujianensis]